MSTTRSVSIMGSITSSGIRVNLLFCMFNVSNEFKFSNASAGSASILKFQQTKELIGIRWFHVREVDIDNGDGVEWNKTYSFFCKFKNVMESP